MANAHRIVPVGIEFVKVTHEGYMHSLNGGMANKTYTIEMESTYTPICLYLCDEHEDVVLWNDRDLLLISLTDEVFPQA